MSGLRKGGPKLPVDPGPAAMIAALDAALAADNGGQAPVIIAAVPPSLRQVSAVRTQNAAIAKVIDLQKQFARDSASWQHCEDLMGDMQRVVELISQ